MSDRDPAAETGAVLGPGSRPASANLAEAREAVTANHGVEAREAADMSRAEAEFREAVGNDYAPGLAVIQAYVDRLSPEELAASPNSLVELGIRALEHGPKGREPLPRSIKDIEAEIEKCEDRMRNDRDAWMRDDRAQLRYRYALTAREGLKSKEGAT